MSTKAAAETSTLTPARSHARLILMLVLIAGFLDVVDFSIVQVALSTIQREFVVSLAESQWIIGAYGLTMAGARAKAYYG